MPAALWVSDALWLDTLTYLGAASSSPPTPPIAHAGSTFGGAAFGSTPFAFNYGQAAGPGPDPGTVWAFDGATGASRR